MKKNYSKKHCFTGAIVTESKESKIITTVLAVVVLVIVAAVGSFAVADAVKKTIYLGLLR